MVQMMVDGDRGRVWAEMKVECCGWELVQYLARLHAQDCGEADTSSNESEKETACVIELDLDYLKSLDPKEWKSQDHYAVLGLKDLRYKASSGDIKSAYRQAVLTHHPDKRKAKGESVDQDTDYFTCITMAWETLGDIVKRRAYDSVDPTVDDNLPSSTATYTDQQFYREFGDAFSRNGRWSEKQQVPQLGSGKTARSQVDSFYSFWYDFQSWREYSYEDEESKDKGQDRDERRWIEKQNRVVRAKKKREEMTRIRSLVDSAYGLDPRIKRFRQEDRDRKEAVKKAKAQAAKDRQMEIDRAKREEEEEKKRLKEEQAAEEKAKQTALKQERETVKKNLRKEKKTLRDTCKANNYYVTSEDQEAANMRAVELLCESMSLDELKTFNSSLKDGGREVFSCKVTEVEKKVEQERFNSFNSGKSKDKSSGSTDNKDRWTEQQVTLLIKGVNLFPAGTNQRWEVVANFINQHAKSVPQKNAKDVLVKAKEMQNNGDVHNSIKQAANKKAYENFEKQKKTAGQVDEVETSQRFDDSPWTSDEQKLLEQALKTYSANHSDRWENIAAAVPTRNKKECMKRYKELVEMVKAKKMAVKNTNTA